MGWISSPGNYLEPQSHAAEYTALCQKGWLNCFLFPKGIPYKNPKCRLTVANHRPDETIIYKFGLHQPIPAIFTSASFALNHCTRFVAKLCPMLPFNYDEDFMQFELSGNGTVVTAICSDLLHWSCLLWARTAHISKHCISPVSSISFFYFLGLAQHKGMVSTHH